MNDYTLRHTEEREGFTIKLYTTWEDSSPDWELSEEDSKQLLEDIENGKLEWFIAKVTAEKMGIELASDYLGGCCYRTIEKFIADSYYRDMVDTVIIEARQRIQQLKELS
jgi:hypothetical protein